MYKLTYQTELEIDLIINNIIMKEYSKTKFSFCLLIKKGCTISYFDELTIFLNKVKLNENNNKLRKN